MHNLISFSGGAIYVVGLATSLKTLADHGIKISQMKTTAFAGNSAGSIVAGLLASGFDEKQIYDAVMGSVNKAMVKWPLYKRYFKRSVLDHGPLEEKLFEFFGTTRMCDLKTPLYITAVPTNSRNNWKVFDRLDKTEVWQAVRASASAPPYYQPITIDGVEYIDGGFGRNNPSEVLLNGVYKHFSLAPEECRVIHWRTTGVTEGEKIGPTGYLGAGKFLVNNFLSIGEDCTDVSMVTRLKPNYEGAPNRYFSFVPEDTVKAGFFEKEKIPAIQKMWETCTLQNLGNLELWLQNTEK